MPIRTYGVSVATAAAMAVAAVVVALSYDLPIRDPDSVAGPTYVRLPVILAVCFLTDVVPRAVRRWRRDGTGLWEVTRAVVAERWNRQRLQLVGIGLGSWYITYVAFRNLKSWMPMIRDGSWDATFAQMDEALTLGQDPAVLLHQLLGRGIAAEVMSFVYIAWLVFIPISLAAALVWTRDVRRGMWYITAVSIDWVLGVALYYAFPTVGPVYAEPENYARLADTPNSRLAAMMLDERAEVLADPWTTSAVQNIAAFASLHVAITVTAVIIAWRVGLSRWVRQGLLLFLGLTVLATVYLGWHYLVDAFGGFVVGALAAYLAAVAMGSGESSTGPRDDEALRRTGAQSSAGAARFAGRSTP
ncbi:MAG TPA: phosphatase PAP2 family protein [Nocardioidaceae bacterium]|nr:phosphatase PAP2 family protein [Nocardioidaceae bacterium]